MMFSGSNKSEGIGSTSGQGSSLNSTGISSPYLNFNPAYVTPSDSEYLYPEWSTGASGRGRFELMFNTIGGFTATGGVLGGANGLVRGLRESQAKVQSSSARRTLLLNHIAKGGASWAQTCGVVALMYSGIGTILAKVRGHDDELNTVASGTMAGLLFKSAAGLKPCLRGGAVGFGVTTVYVLLTSRDRVMAMLGR